MSLQIASQTMRQESPYNSLVLLLSALLSEFADGKRTAEWNSAHTIHWFYS